MQAKHQDQRSSHGREGGPVAQQERADGAGGGSESDEDHRKADDEGQRGPDQAAAGGLAFFELFDADAGQHGNIAGNQREYAGREKRDQPRNKSSKDRDAFHQLSFVVGLTAASAGSKPHLGSMRRSG